MSEQPVPMRDVPALVLRDPSLRMLAAGVLLFGTFAASLGIHQSLLAVEVFGLRDARYAVLLLAAMLVSVAASIAMGIAADRGPWRRRMALVATAASLAGALLVTLVREPWAFVVAHALLVPLGATMFGQLFAAGRLASAAHPAATRAGILAALRALFAVPFVVALPLWGLAFAHGLPLLVLYPVTAGVALLHLLLVWRAWPQDHAAPWADAKSGLSLRASLREMAAGPVILRVALVGAIHTASAIMGIVVGLIFARAGRPTGDVGLFFGLFVAVEVLGTLWVGALAGRLPRLRIMAAGVALYACYLGSLPFLAGSPWVWALVLPAGLGGGLIFTPAIAYLQDLLASRPGAGGSLIAVQRLAAEGLATTIYGVGATVQGYATVALLGAGTAALAISALLWLDRRR